MRLWVGDTETLCMDWDERSLRVVHASLSRSSVQVRSAVHVPLDPDVNIRDAAALGAFIRRVLGEHRLRARRVIVDVPRQDTLLNFMSLPRGTVSELAAMVHMQIGKELPFSRDQAVVDFVISGEDAATKGHELWVAAVRNNIVDYYQQVATAAGLKLDRIGLRPYANLAAVTAAGVEPGRTLLVDVGPSMTEIDVVRDGRLVYSRAASVSIPAQGLGAPPAAQPSPPRTAGEALIPFADDLAPRPSGVDALLVEVSRTIEAYRATDPGARIDRIILSGTGGIDTRISETFAHRFGLPVSIYAPPANLRWRPDSPEGAAPFSAALGLALSSVNDSTRYFNFARPKQAEDERRERAKRMPLVASVALLFLLAAGWTLYRPIRQKNIEIAALEAKIEVRQEGEEIRQELLKQIGDLETWNARNVPWLDHLKVLVDEVFTSNEEAYLTRMDFNEHGRIKIDMVAVNDTVATRIATAAAAVRDERGRPVFTGTVGTAKDNPREPEYPVADEVILQVQALDQRPAGR